MTRRYLLSLLGTAVAGLTVPLPGAAERPVTIFAASSLTRVFDALKPEFERAHPGIRLRFSYSASSVLRAQIEQGAPADVFAAADHLQMDLLVRRKRVLAPRTFARNRLVVAVPAANPGRVRSPRDLARRGLRLVATTETVPIGRYTRRTLEKLEKLPGYPPGFARAVEANVVSREPNVRGLLARVELGEADAAMVYESDVRGSRRAAAVPLPPEVNVTAEYPLAVLTDARNRPGAEAFVRFVLSERGQALLRRHGFR